MTEQNAREIAEHWIQDQGYADRIRVDDVIETPRSYLFNLPKIDEQPILGNYPIAVDKKTGTVSQPRGAWVEFLNCKFSLYQRLQRWLARRYYW